MVVCVQDGVERKTTRDVETFDGWRAEVGRLDADARSARERAL